MYDFDKDLICKYEQIKHKIYKEYCKNNISLKQREILLEHARNKIYNNIFNMILESDENENTKTIIEQKELKYMSKLRMLVKVTSDKKDIIDKSINNIDEDKRDNIYFIFLNREKEINSIIKLLDHFYNFITDPSIDSERYNYKKDDLIDELNDSHNNIKFGSYSIGIYKNKFKIEFNESEIFQYEKKYSKAFSTSHLNHIIEDNSENIAIIKNSYNDFFYWFNILLNYKNMYFDQIFRCVKIAETYQNQLYNDYENNKSSYSNLENGTELLKKVFQSVYKEYDDIINSNFEY